jgi:hypothetical protein
VLMLVGRCNVWASAATDVEVIVFSSWKTRPLPMEVVSLGEMVMELVLHPLRHSLATLARPEMEKKTPTNTIFETTNPMRWSNFLGLVVVTLRCCE